MAGMASGNTGEVSSEPNVIPMIDILLVLLIIFMISQPLTRMAIPVQVPPEKQVASTVQSTQIVLEIQQDGSYKINGQPVPAGEGMLAAQIHQIYDNRPTKMIFVKVHPERLYQDLVIAMDIMRGAGIEVIGFTPKGT